MCFKKVKGILIANHRIDRKPKIKKISWKTEVAIAKKCYFLH